MKKLEVILLSAFFVACTVCLTSCEKIGPIPNGNYGFIGAVYTFEYTEKDVKDSYGWIIDGDTAEQWTSGSCNYKAKIIERDGEICFDGFQWRDWLDKLLVSEGKRGSNHDYIVAYDETKKSITLSPVDISSMLKQ